MRVVQVKKGDTLEAIASEYGVSVGVLIGINNLSGAYVDYGERLVIPMGGRLHIVKPLETIYSIAKEYSVDVNNLKAANFTEIVYIGQQIII
ncbi:MAG: LysM peptidoglycan-binding domain-containing protein [Firmicutes bacterium]|nr:LysM peptidoglycan-binding domain-containing protein [Bacillota bacterium]